MDGPVAENALSTTPWRTMKLLGLHALDRIWLSSQRSQSSVIYFGAMPWRMLNIKVAYIIWTKWMARHWQPTEPLHLHKSTSPALSQDDAEERIVVVLFSCDSGMHVPKQ